MGSIELFIVKSVHSIYMVDIDGISSDKVGWMKSRDDIYNRLCMTYAFQWRG